MRKIDRDNFISFHRSSCKVRTANTFVRFQGNVNFMDTISKPTQNSSFLEILSVEQSCLVWTDINDEANNCSSQFYKAPKTS